MCRYISKKVPNSKEIKYILYLHVKAIKYTAIVALSLYLKAYRGKQKSARTNDARIGLTPLTLPDKKIYLSEG